MKDSLYLLKMAISQGIYNYIARYAKKLKLIELLGGKCPCGEDNIASLEFHHVNENDKIDEINFLLMWNIERAIEESKKCILLCRNCHNEHHYIKNKTKDTKHTKNKELFLQLKNTNKCQNCEYSKCIACLDFHHRIPSDKKFRLSNISHEFNHINELTEKVILEIEKCDLICKNCHSKEHFNFEKFEKYKSQISTWIENPTRRKPAYNKNLILELKAKGMRNKDIVKELGCHYSTITKILNNA